MKKNNTGAALKVTSQPKPEYENADIRKILGKNIRVALDDIGIKKKDAAKLLDVSPATITYWTKGERIPDVFQLRKISELTDKTLEWFHEEHKYI